MPFSLSAFLASLRALVVCQILPWLPAVNLGMLRNRKGHKILGAVIVGYSVDVVNVFIRLQGATVGLFPDNAMLKDIALAVSPWIVRHVKQDMGPLVNAPTLPFVAIGTRVETARRMAAQIGRRIALEMTGSPIGVISDFCRQPAATLAETGRDFLGRRMIHLVGLRNALVASGGLLSVVWQKGHRVALPIPGWWRCVCRNLVDGQTTATFTGSIRGFVGLRGMFVELRHTTPPTPIIA